MLLLTRRILLERDGFQVSHSAPTEVVEDLPRISPDVVIACHTLTREESDVVVRTASSMESRPALVGFTKELEPLPTAYPYDSTIWSLANPDTFLGKVRQVLANRFGRQTF